MRGRRPGPRALLLVALLLPGAAAAAPAVVVARGDGEVPPAVVAELAQRCPARQLPFGAIQPLLPRLSDQAAAPAGDLPDMAGLFFSGEDRLQSAAQLRRAAAELEAEPAALLASPERRQRFLEANLFAARALLEAGRTEEARGLLERTAARLPDLPPLSPARWGPATAAALAEAQRQLPAPVHVVVIEGPPGWAVHVDEQPLGPLPRQETRLRPGPHAVVAVGPDGERATWQLDLAQVAAGPLRLLIDRRLADVCAIGEAVGLCGDGAAPALAEVIGDDLIVLRRRGERLVGWRARPGVAPSPAAEAPLGGGAAGVLARALCPQLPAPAPAAPPLLALRREAPRRTPLWPGLLLLGAGVAIALGGVPLFVQDGRCVDEECTLVYDFRGLPAGLAGAGAALSLGGVVWLAVVLRR